MAIQRIVMYTTKTNAAIKQQNKEIGKLLSERKDENARIRMEGVIRHKNMLKAVEILSLMCEILGQRLQLIITQNFCSPDLLEPVATIIYCANRIAEIPEFMEITEQFAFKYIIEWALTHRDNESNCVSPRIIALLSLRPPNFSIVMKALKEVAEEQGVDWEPSEPAPDETQKMGAIVPLVSTESVPHIYLFVIQCVAAINILWDRT